MKYLQDITGGIAATMPSMADWENPETRPYLEKYLQGVAKYPTEERIRAINAVIRNGSTFSGVLSIHAEGSLATQKMVLYQMADWEKFKAAARRNLGLPTDHPDFKDLPTEPPWKMPASLERGD
jgi:4-hydroxybutyryl-CoA dehydratase/vinylacetyl-CoA-Delta-isomerase